MEILQQTARSPAGCLRGSDTSTPTRCRPVGRLFDGEPAEKEEQALPDGPITVGIDGGYVRASQQRAQRYLDLHPRERRHLDISEHLRQCQEQPWQTCAGNMVVSNWTTPSYYGETALGELRVNTWAVPQPAYASGGACDAEGLYIALDPMSVARISAMPGA
jgi:hypothetical protein